VREGGTGHDDVTNSRAADERKHSERDAVSLGAQRVCRYAHDSHLSSLRLQLSSGTDAVRRGDQYGCCALLIADAELNNSSDTPPTIDVYSERLFGLPAVVDMQRFVTPLIQLRHLAIFHLMCSKYALTLRTFLWRAARDSAASAVTPWRCAAHPPPCACRAPPTATRYTDASLGHLRASIVAALPWVRTRAGEHPGLGLSLPPMHGATSAYGRRDERDDGPP
jgi:hypothetical protein